MTTANRKKFRSVFIRKKQIETTEMKNLEIEDKCAQEEVLIPEKNSVTKSIYVIIGALRKWRINNNIKYLLIKSLFEIVPSVFSMITLYDNLIGVCVIEKLNYCSQASNSLPQYCGIATSNGVDYNVPITDGCVCALFIQPLCSTNDYCYVFNQTGIAPGELCTNFPEVALANLSTVEYPVRMANAVQLSLTIISVTFETALMLVTIKQFRWLHTKTFYLIGVTVTLLAQIVFCIYLAINAASFGYNSQTMTLLVASKVLAVTFGSAHLSYLIVVQSNRWNALISCLRYNLEPKIEQ